MNIETAVALVAAAFEHSAVLECYKHGDTNSGIQTKHDIGHAKEVLQSAREIVDFVAEIQPQKLDEWTTKVVVPLAAFLHDIGRAINVENHDSEGATWIQQFLTNTLKTAAGETLPEEIIDRVARIVAHHRTSKYIKATFDDPALDIVLIADKCVGDEARVRPGRGALLRVMSWCRLAHLCDGLREGGIHDRANFAIKASSLECVHEALVLNLRFATHICSVEELCRLYGDRYHCCVLAAGKLGLEFLIKVNGDLYYEQRENDWTLKQTTCKASVRMQYKVRKRT